MQKKISRDAAEDAVRTLLTWIGEDPNREGLKETPKRFIDSMEDFFSGYKLDPAVVLSKTFSEIEGYRDFILLRDIRVESHCEHHLAPIIGFANIAYIPADYVVGISKLARIVNVFAKRLQIQERLTAQIAAAIESALRPQGVAVLITANHHCMTTRGVHHTDSKMETHSFLGQFQSDESLRREFFSRIKV